MNNFEVVIGIEVHVVVDSKTKMFSNAKNDYNSEPNTLVSFMDLALPGILPIVNKKVINKAIILANALYMEVNYQNIQFDRKNYFYPDLPKGFQITQQYFPIGTNGIIKILDDANNSKDVYIERIHLEEDTAKQIIEGNYRLMDYNRSGSPLIEIVSKPCIHSANEAMNYLTALKRILTFMDVSQAQMENGLMRADVNLSIRPIGSTQYGTRVEIKNINSISNVGKAIEYEIKRHTEVLLSGNQLVQETRRYNDSLNITESLRSKSNAIDYRYMTEPNIVSFCYDEQTYKQIVASSPKLLDNVINTLKNDGLDQKQIDLLLDNHDLYKLYDNITTQVNNKKLVFNWLSTEVVGLLNKTNIELKDLSNFFIKEFTTLLILLDQQEINSKQAKILFQKLHELNKGVHELIKELGFEQIKDPNVIGSIIDKYINENQALMKEYPTRPERVEKFLVGMVMKDTNSQANPNVINDVMMEKLKPYKS